MALHLTFDDGPDPVWTPVVLDALAAAGATATFFVLGPRVRAHPDLVRATVAAGHRVEPHADQHDRHDRMDRHQIRADTDAVVDALRAVDVEPTRWRTPWGLVTDDTRRVADDVGLALVGWDADTHDWRGDLAEEMVVAIKREAPNGGIVLAHDGLGPGATRPGCAETARLIPMAAAWGVARGLTLEPLPEPRAAPATLAFAGKRP
ncbi:polysaccharide deacetylase family protein [Patulibacter minatonensis]|uniref:polysaccharide deacetylase family protein n=1 Tax=Patulibacter minatonensis TaxID=298163 RepID=UPI000689170C|nr:polysaccharide deacetylase family protein [Patulibacter minatonensis]